MTAFKDKNGKRISASEFCKGHPNPPERWLKQAALEKPAPKKTKKAKELTDGNTDPK